MKEKYFKLLEQTEQMKKKIKEKDFLLLDQIHTMRENLKGVSSLSRPDDIADSDLRLNLEKKLNETFKRLDFMKKCIESEEYKKTLYIEAIKRIYIFIREYESGRFEGRDSEGLPCSTLPDFRCLSAEIVEGMWKLLRTFDFKATDTIRKLLDYIEKANLPIKELPWEYQALVIFIMSAAYVDQDREGYFIIKIDEILIKCGLGGCIPNIGEPVEEEKE